MDINTLRGLSTLFLLIAFLGLVFWAYSSKRYAESVCADRSPDEPEGVRECCISDYDGCATGSGSKRQSYVPEADMYRTVARVVCDRAPRGSSGNRVAVTVDLLDQYVISPWHDAQPLSLIASAMGNNASSAAHACVLARRSLQPACTI